MRRAEIWWADLPKPSGRRPVVLLSRDEAYSVRDLVIVGLVTTRIRGIPTEVPLGPTDGLPKACVANLDTVLTIRKDSLVSRIAAPSIEKRVAIDKALKFALGLSP